MRNLTFRGLRLPRLGAMTDAANVIVSFDPASLFGAGDDGWYWEPSLATTFTDVARTTPTTVGGPVGGVTDLSGKENHGFQEAAVRRVTLRQAANGRYFYESDAVEDVLRCGMNMNGKRMTVAMAYRPIARDSMFMSDGLGGSKFVGVAQPGNGSTTLAASATINYIRLGNVLFTGTTRGALYTSVQANKSFIFDATISAGAWEPGFGKYQAFQIHPPGDIFAIFGIDREITSTERANLDAHLLALVP